jgi:translation elongation factor EF-Ts
VLLDQPFVRDEKQSVSQFVGSGGGSVVRFGQLFIGG